MRKPIDLLSLCAALLFSGCAYFSTVAPGNDPVVVNAERTAKLSFATVDGFLEWEYVNRAFVPLKVTQVADVLRSDFPPAYHSLRVVTHAYKVNRDAQNKASLETAKATVLTMLQEAQKYLPPPDQAKAIAKADAMKTVPETATHN